MSKEPTKAEMLAKQRHAAWKYRNFVARKEGVARRAKERAAEKATEAAKAKGSE